MTKIIFDYQALMVIFMNPLRVHG